MSYTTEEIEQIKNRILENLEQVIDPELGIDIVNLVKREVTGGNQTIGIRPEGGRRVVFREIEEIIVAGTLRDADSLHVVSGSVSVVDETSRIGMGVLHDIVYTIQGELYIT